ncbi:MAG: SDR family oxidoreductase [Coriobacteriia bacterium]|nr:SDR family oxidoreductase [Coriobacteriia bacterium]
MFEGARVVVTGGSSGIGLATAELFARRGAHVGLVARDPGRLEAAREAVAAAAAEGARIEAVSADLSQTEQARHAIDELARRGLEPDVLVNSAGVILPGRFEEMPLDFFTRNMDCGYYSVVYPTRAAVPYMIARGAGHVVNVSSVAGFIGVYGYTGYSAAKYAVMGFSEALRCEMKPRGVRVSVVCPPDTDTPGLAYEKTLRPPETDVIAGNVKAIPPAAVAKAVVRAVERGTYLVIPGLESRAYHKLKGLWPGLFFAVFDSQVAKARRAEERGG